MKAAIVIAAVVVAILLILGIRKLRSDPTPSPQPFVTQSPVGATATPVDDDFPDGK